MAITNGYCTLDNYKTYGIPDAGTNADDDAVIEKLIEMASRYIDRKTGRTFYARTETHYFDYPKTRFLKLSDDLLSVTTLTNGDGNTIADTEYNLIEYNTTPYYALELTDISTTFWQPTSSGSYLKCIQLAGSWGYSAIAPDDIEIATMDIVKNAYNRRKGKNLAGVATITGAGVVISPADISDLTKDTIRHFRRRI